MKNKIAILGNIDQKKVNDYFIADVCRYENMDFVGYAVYNSKHG